MWLPLAEYSMKHKLSISTLRRRIKAEDIQYRLEDGKYFILDTAPVGSSDPALQQPAAPQLTATQQPKNSEAHRPSLKSESPEFQGESVITAANRLLTDLKKAYTQVLQDKEEQILSLKEEISDLRTLVRILESENNRLNKNNEPTNHHDLF